jgi:hypothetical protein
MNLERRLNDRTAPCRRHRLGYVGLPQALGMAQAGFRTVGIDVDARRIANLMAGRSHIEDVPRRAAPPPHPREALRGHDRLRRARRRGRDHHLRPDAAQQDEGP